MKQQKRSNWVVICLCLAWIGALGAGCTPSKIPNDHSQPHESVVHWHFVEGRGVQLDNQGEAVIGLELTEVVVSEEDALEVPLSSLLETVRGTFVYVQNGNYYFRLPVQVGGKSGDQAAILEGLFEGDVIASQGAKMLWLTELQSINGGAACTHSH